MLSSASRSSFRFIAAHLCASFAAGLSLLTNATGLALPIGLALGILLPPGDRGLANDAPILLCWAGDPA